MARYLGMQLDGLEGAAFRWIAEEALHAELPEDWEQHVTEEGAVYYYHPVLKESSWEHPKDAYYRCDWMCKERVGQWGLACTWLWGNSHCDESGECAF